LLAKVKELGDALKSDLVRSAGYVNTKKDGTERACAATKFLIFTAISSFQAPSLACRGVLAGAAGYGEPALRSPVTAVSGEPPPPRRKS
jgi:hypothetical protein